ncbi:MAG TPA: SAM-dependent methyltransferase [Methylotenera sp.]|nr:SAM-dependent methyltransferase [Methylotenera sp.]HPV44779.1 SAM-dependent methyltransferase [Methylotenera sp.]
MAIPSNKNLPIPPLEAQTLSQQLGCAIQQAIAQNGGWISFADFMHAALYTPNLGYYAGGARKFGHGGDFVTAPEISPVFAQTLARQAAQILKVSKGNILELGAGTGKLAADLLLELAQLHKLPSQYFILEVSDYLRQVQRETCQEKLPAELFAKLTWLETLPEKFSGLILGNEVLDAIPVHLLHKTAEGWGERGVSFTDEFVWQDAPLSAPSLAENLPDDLPQDYVTEVCPAASALVRSLAEILETGAIILIDYGFSAREYYHPQRSQGTLMCHYQHLAHSNPLTHIGLQDITAHVNFTQIAQVANLMSSGEAHVIRLAGYVNQARFLINCGILELLQQFSPHEPQYMKLVAAAQKLMSPAEMGELFKVIALTKNMELPLLGFAQGDKAHTL